MLTKPCLKVQNLQYIFGLKMTPRPLGTFPKIHPALEAPPFPLSLHIIVRSTNIFAGKKKDILVMILPVQEDWRIVVGHEIPEIKSTQTNIFLCCIFRNCLF